MSDEHLEQALQAMKQEDVDSGTLHAARARVWEAMRTADDGTCAEFREDFRGYLAGQLGGGRRLLVEDHLSRCPACRLRIASSRACHAQIPIRITHRIPRKTALFFITPQCEVLRCMA